MALAVNDPNPFSMPNQGVPQGLSTGPYTPIQRTTGTELPFFGGAQTMASNPFGIGTPGSSNSLFANTLADPGSNPDFYYSNIYPGMASVQAAPGEMARLQALMQGADRGIFNRFLPQGGGVGMDDSGNSGIPFQGDPTAGFTGSAGGLANFNPRADPTGVNHNIYANFLAAQSPIALVLSQMLTAGEAPMRLAQQWLAQNVRPDATTANPGADTSAINRYWVDFNNSISRNGNATVGVNTLGNGVDTPTTTTTTGNGITYGPPSSGPNTTPNGLITGTASSGQFGFNKGNITPYTPAATSRLNSSMQAYLNQIDAGLRSLGVTGTITDDIRRQYHYPTSAELQMNQDFRANNQGWTPNANQFIGDIASYSNLPYMPTGGAPQGFQYQWVDPDGAGPLAGNYALRLQTPPQGFNDFQGLYNTMNNAAYGNKFFDMGALNSVFAQNAPGTTGPRFQTDINNPNAYFSYATNTAPGALWTHGPTGSALGNFIRSLGPDAVDAAVHGRAYDPGPGAGYQLNTTKPPQEPNAWTGPSTPNVPVNNNVQNSADPWANSLGSTPSRTQGSTTSLW